MISSPPPRSCACAEEEEEEAAAKTEGDVESSNGCRDDEVA